MSKITVTSSVKPGELRKWAVDIAEKSAERVVRRLAEMCEVSIKTEIMNSSKMPTGALANAFFKIQFSKYHWGVGDIDHLNEAVPYWRHCLSDDTEVYVFIDNKLIPVTLSDLFDCWNKNKNIKILTPNGLKSIKNMREVFDSEFYDFNFSSYFNVKMSKTHKLIYKLNKNFIEKQADSFKKSTRFYSGLYSTLSSFNGTVIKDITIDNKTIKLDYLYGWVIGFTLADGCVTRKNTVAWAQKGIFRIYTYLNKFCSMFNYTMRIYDTDDIDKLLAYNKTIWHFIKYFCTGKSTNKHIQNFYLNTPKRFRRGILDGYNEGDGRKADKDKYNIRTISLKLRNQLVLIGASLGYDISILKNQKRSNKSFFSLKPVYNAYIYKYCRRWHVKQNKCLKISKPKNERERTKTGTFKKEQGKKVNFEYFPKSIIDIKHVKNKIRMVDLAVEDELFLINGGIVSHNCNYGSEAIGANWEHILPMGHWENGRWVEGNGDDDFFAVPNTSIQAHNYIERTIADMQLAINQVISEG